MTLEVRTATFVGPLDVLVKLLVSQEVDIWEVSLTRLVDDFLRVMAAENVTASHNCNSNHTASAANTTQDNTNNGGNNPATPNYPVDKPAQPSVVAGPVAAHSNRAADNSTLDNNRDYSVNIDAASEFALLVATLIELKSRRLLPDPPVELDLEEELASYGLRDTAMARLLEGQTFGAAARLLSERWNQASLRWPRIAGPPEHFWACTPDLLEGAKPDDLAAAMERVLAPRPTPQVDISHLRAAAMTVEEAAAAIVERLAESGPATFRELTGDISERMVVVAYFLALLELFGSGHVELTQAERFGDIGVEWIGDDTTQLAATVIYGEDAA